MKDIWCWQHLTSAVEIRFFILSSVRMEGNSIQLLKIQKKGPKFCTSLQKIVIWCGEGILIPNRTFTWLSKELKSTPFQEGIKKSARCFWKYAIYCSESFHGSFICSTVCSSPNFPSISCLQCLYYVALLSKCILSGENRNRGWNEWWIPQKHVLLSLQVVFKQSFMFMKKSFAIKKTTLLILINAFSVSNH